MGLTIAWSIPAINSLRSILAYIENEFGKSSSDEFYVKVQKRLLVIAEFPNSYPVKYRKLRRTVISKQTSLFYKHHP